MQLHVKPQQGGGGGGGGGGPAHSRLLRCATCAADHPLPPLGDLSANAHRCPLCSFQVVTLTNSVTGKSHTVCPSCFSRRPPPRAAQLDDDRAALLRVHRQVPARRRRAAGAPVPDARLRGAVVAKQKKDQGGAFFSCKQHPACNFTVWLPGGATVALASAAPPCARCGQQPLDFTFKSSSLSPHLRQPYDAVCLCGSNPDIIEVLREANEEAAFARNLDAFLAAQRPRPSRRGAAAAAAAEEEVAAAAAAAAVATARSLTTTAGGRWRRRWCAIRRR